MKIDLKNKKTILIISVCIIAVILICGGIYFIVNKNQNKESRISQLYTKLENSEKYSFIMNQSDGYKINMAKKGNITSIDMNSEDMHTTTLVKEGKAYFINHDEKIYSAYEDATANENILFEELSRVKSMEKIEGKEKINGKEYKYEEYTGYSGFMYSSNIDVEEESIKTKFYFDKNDLKYIKTIIADGEEELIEVSISYAPEDSLFEVPSDYEEIK